ncbi:apolipoprotein M [Trichomycterus rosablanca]|uniref:apolipoprotein M n=1 Tax=Trichomycterus rosablanca TaxID=2290929 RepID=UPI002F35FFB1
MIGSVLTIIYTLAQALMPCLPPVPLSHEVLTTDQYLGKWYFVGVASWDNEDIAAFQGIDSTVVELKKADKDTLVMAGALRQNDQCNNTAWTYKLDSNFDPIMTEGEDHIGVALSGNWIKCPLCMMFAKIHPNEAFIRIMLFARSESVPAEVVHRFKAKMKCSLVIDTFMMTAQTKEFCELE